MEIRVRFAPSPTGEMHIANLRAAIYNWIFARKYGGKFFVRIEDTDAKRSKKEYEDSIFKVLSYMGLDVDKFNDSHVRQSERLDIYQSYAKILLEKGHAYYCQCDNEVSEDMVARPCHCENHHGGVLRYRVPKNRDIRFKDAVFGDLCFPSNSLENFALIRSDGSPTYMFAVVIDDHLMEISHVIRGDDHQTNTFKQILLYESFGWQHPQFCHLAMIKGTDGKKLSKRHGHTSVKHYIEEGYVANAIFNFVIKLGWGYGNEEIISRQRMLDIFELKQLKQSAAIFDLKKLRYFAGYYLRNENHIPAIKQLLEQKGIIVSDAFLNKLYGELTCRCVTLGEVVNMIIPIVQWQPLENYMAPQNLLLEVLDLMETKPWNELEDHFRQKQNFREYANMLRLIITGQPIAPNVFQIIQALEPSEVFRRLKTFLI